MPLVCYIKLICWRAWAIGCSGKINKAKRLAKHQRSNVINALACVSCAQSKIPNWLKQKKKLHESVVNSGGPL